MFQTYLSVIPINISWHRLERAESRRKQHTTRAFRRREMASAKRASTEEVHSGVLHLLVGQIAQSRIEIALKKVSLRCVVFHLYTCARFDSLNVMRTVSVLRGEDVHLTSSSVPGTDVAVFLLCRKCVLRLDRSCWCMHFTSSGG